MFLKIYIVFNDKQAKVSDFSSYFVKNFGC
jgi:hypothetical protein